MILLSLVTHHLYLSVHHFILLPKLTRVLFELLLLSPKFLTLEEDRHDNASEC